MTNWLIVGLTVLWLPFAAAQALRDPTIPPPEAGLPSTQTDIRPEAVEQEPLSVVVRNGQSYVVWGSHLVAPGAILNGRRLEKITATEVWLRDGKQRLKVPRFESDIQIRPASP